MKIFNIQNDLREIFRTIVGPHVNSRKTPSHSGFPCVSFKYENDMPKNAYKPKNFKL